MWFNNIVDTMRLTGDQSEVYIECLLNYSWEYFVQYSFSQRTTHEWNK